MSSTEFSISIMKYTLEKYVMCFRLRKFTRLKSSSLNLTICIFLLFFFQLCFDLIQEWIVNNPKASICTYEGVQDFQDTAIFQDYHGLPEFRKVYIYIYM